MKCQDCKRNMKSTKEVSVLIEVANVSVVHFVRKLCKTCLSKLKRRDR